MSSHFLIAKTCKTCATCIKLNLAMVPICVFAASPYGSGLTIAGQMKNEKTKSTQIAETSRSVILPPSRSTVWSCWTIQASAHGKQNKFDLIPFINLSTKVASFPMVQFLYFCKLFIYSTVPSSPNLLFLSSGGNLQVIYSSKLWKVEATRHWQLTCPKNACSLKNIYNYRDVAQRRKSARQLSSSE